MCLKMTARTEGCQHLAEVSVGCEALLQDVLHCLDVVVCDALHLQAAGHTCHQSASRPELSRASRSLALPSAPASASAAKRFKTYSTALTSWFVTRSTCRQQVTPVTSQKVHGRLEHVDPRLKRCAGYRWQSLISDLLQQEHHLRKASLGAAEVQRAHICDFLRIYDAESGGERVRCMP